MRTQNYRPRVHSGTHTRRRTVPSAIHLRSRSHHSRRKSESRGQGARVLWILMLIGGLIGSGFVMAQQSQINVHQFKQAEERFRTQLDELTNQQRYLALEKERVINTQESERIARQSGLVQPKLDRMVAQPPQSELPATPVARNASMRIVPKPEAKPIAKRVVKPAVQLKPLAKPPVPKIVGKGSKGAPSGKLVKGGKQQQPGQKAIARKERRR